MPIRQERLKAPFPYFGGKSRIASVVWSQLGKVDNYIEPFAGSLAVLLLRPHKPHIETVNDIDCMVANFWRATQCDPEAVASHADNPVNECDLHARHRWLVLSDDAKAFRERMKHDPEYYDARIAGWWCWGLCCWIGRGWCASDWQQSPHLARYGQGIHAKGPSQQRPGSTCADRRAWLLDWFGRLRDRLRNVRVCCGDWSRVCSSESTTTGVGLCGVFLDPPYSHAAGRDTNLYATDSATVADDVRAWCITNGSRPQMRIALAGYEGEHEELAAHGWQVVEWKTQGGYGNQSKKNSRAKANAKRERLWFSPHYVAKPLKAEVVRIGTTI